MRQGPDPHRGQQADRPRGPRWEGHGAPDLVHKRITLVGSGAWHKGYVVGMKQGQIPRGTYVEQKMLSPVTIGAPIIYIAPKIHESHENGKRHRSFDYSVTVEV